MSIEVVRTIVFSDLDGTLLDENYSFEVAQPVIARLKALKVPIVLCSSKTRMEIEYFRTKMEINDPFISENGAAIFVPTGYFEAGKYWTKQTKQYDIIELGIAYSSIRKKFERIRKTCTNETIGFGDMTIEEITKDSGLTIELAELAKQRRKIGPYLIGDLHVVVDADLTVRDSGKIAYEIEELVKKEFDEVIEIKVRIDPDEPIPN